MGLLMTRLREIERDYRSDIMFQLRKAINERFYGLRKADEYKRRMLQKLEPEVK
jgi:hypothetical protein